MLVGLFHVLQTELDLLWILYLKYSVSKYENKILFVINSQY
jgi:hypothetical protein